MAAKAGKLTAYGACRTNYFGESKGTWKWYKIEDKSEKWDVSFCDTSCSRQRWSRGHKARGQGQGHKKIRGQGQVQGQGQPFLGQNLSRPRTGMLEAKAKDKGHRRKRSPKKKVFKNFFQAISNSLAYPKFLIKEGLNHKSHDMTSSKFFQTGSFCGTKIS